MSPVRIIILAILGYILYRLLFGVKKKNQQARSTGGKDLPAEDVLVEDPVCHTYVPSKQAIRAVKNGKQYFFCSDKCCQKFLEDKGEGE
ncbi:MAG: YHS domain-containing protein [Pseudomonadota bacterium]